MDQPEKKREEKPEDQPKILKEGSAPPFKSWLIGLVIFFLLVTTTLAFLYFVCGRGGDGKPPQDRDLQPTLTSLPEEENGYRYFARACSAQEDLFFDDKTATKEGKDLLDRWGKLREGLRWKDELLSKTLKAFQKSKIAEKNKKGLSLLYQAIQCKDCRYPFKEIKISGKVLPFDGLSNYKIIGLLKGLYHFKQGREKEGLYEILSMIRFGYLLTRTTILTEFMSGLGILEDGLRAWREMVHRTKLKGKDLGVFTSELEKYHLREKDLLAEIFRKDYVSMSQVIDEIGRGDYRNLGMTLPTAEPFMRVFFYQPNNTKRIFAQAMRTNIEALSEKTLQKALAHEKNLPQIERGSWINLYAKSLFFFPAFSAQDQPFDLGVLVMIHRYRAVLTLTQTHLAIKSYRMDQGKLPSSLKELVPQYLRKIPVDNWDGSPLRYDPVKKEIQSHCNNTLKVREKGDYLLTYPVNF